MTSNYIRDQKLNSTTSVLNYQKKTPKVYLRHQTVEVGVGGALNVKEAPADVINGFII